MAGAVWVRLPLMPVTVTVDVAVGVLPEVVTVSTELPGAVTVEGVRVAVAPAGWPAAVRATGPVNPPCTARVRGKSAVAPGLRVIDAVPLANVKSGGTITFMVTGPAARTRLPLAPLIVMVDVATGVLAAVVTVSVLEPPPATLAGVKLAVAPTGSPAAVSVIAPAKFFNPVTVTV
jgi:hypothetical protein